MTLPEIFEKFQSDVGEYVSRERSEMRDRVLKEEVEPMRLRKTEKQIADLTKENQYLREIEVAARKMLDGISNKYDVRSVNGIKGNHMRAFAEAIGWTPPAQERCLAEEALKILQAEAEKWEKVTDWKSLKVGDVVRIVRKNGSVDQGAIEARNASRYCLEGWFQVGTDTSNNVLDYGDVLDGRVLRKVAARKPYVKDGRWVAQVGDRFRPTLGFDSRIFAVETVYGDGYSLSIYGHSTLHHTAWEPVS